MTALLRTLRRLFTGSPGRCRVCGCQVSPTDRECAECFDARQY